MKVYKWILLFLALIILLALLFLPGYALAYGPYNAQVVKVIDGDTLKIDIALYPGLSKRINLRVNGINTPETKRASECEKKAGRVTTAYVQDLVDKYQGKIAIDNLKLGKFAGRVLGDVSIGGNDLAFILINKKFARPYYGGKRIGWCE